MNHQISADEVKKIAKLARLKLDAKGVADAEGYLAEILNYVDMLASVSVTGVQPYAIEAIPLSLLRRDEVHEFPERTTLLKEKNFTKDHLLKTKAVFEHDES